jgi:hypothetical protein
MKSNWIRVKAVHGLYISFYSRLSKEGSAWFLAILFCGKPISHFEGITGAARKQPRPKTPQKDAAVT